MMTLTQEQQVKVDRYYAQLGQPFFTSEDELTGKDWFEAMTILTTEGPYAIPEPVKLVFIEQCRARGLDPTYSGEP
jgi:hypothetical protein